MRIYAKGLLLYRPVTVALMLALFACATACGGPAASNHPTPTSQQGVVQTGDTTRAQFVEPNTQRGPRRSATPAASRGIAGEAQNPSVRRVRVDTVIKDLAASLEAGHLATAEKLRSTPLSSVVDNILSIDGFQIHDLSSESLVREVYRRAEARSTGQGEHVLAYLYKEAEVDFGAMRTEPALDGIRRIASDPSLTLDPSTFRFASAEAAAKIKVSPALKAAIGQLAYVYSAGNLSQLRRLALTHFRKPGFDFEKIVSRSSNSRDAITRMFAAGTPPPRPEAAGEAIMRSTLEHNGTLRNKTEFISSIMELRGELGLSELDPELKSYTAHEDRIPSRQAQMKQAEEISLPGKISKPDSASVLRTAAPVEKTAQVVARAQFARHFNDYISSSFEPPDDFDPRSRNSSSPRTGPPGGGPRVSRSYRTAIRSSRAARGVAAGGSVKSAFFEKPISAAWVANQEDGRFGRLVIEMEDTKGTKFLAVSRTLFADSYYSATTVLWGDNALTWAFQESEILVLMSMDPFTDPDPTGRSNLDRKARELRSRALLIPESDLVAQRNIYDEFRALMETAQRLPRRVVVHPALFGRELAWSAVRVDFWFNDVKGLSDESSMINGGKTMPASMRYVDVSEANTWQFFERDSTIELSRRDGINRLVVRSSGPDGFAPSERSHFAVSMFHVDSEEAGREAEGRRLPSLERRLQVMLDWLATNHHDFMRLNDFSESFSLMRWLKRHGVAPILIDMDGEAPGIATPDRIVIGEGPRVR